MTVASQYPQLAGLSGILHKQRRLTAGQIRISNEERALRDEMRTLLDQVGLTQVECNGYLIQRWTGRDGRETSKVSPIRSET